MRFKEIAEFGRFCAEFREFWHDAEGCVINGAKPIKKVVATGMIIRGNRGRLWDESEIVEKNIKEARRL